MELHKLTAVLHRCKVFSRSMTESLKCIQHSMECGMKLFLSLAVLQNLLPEASGENSPWWGGKESDNVSFLSPRREKS